MRHRIALYRPAPSQEVDSAGDFLENFELVATVWGSIEPLSGNEFFFAQQVHATHTHTMVIRWRTDVSPRWRAVTHDGRTFELGHAADTEGRKRDLVILATQRFQEH